ncbi:MAG: hypothetical protein HY000_19755, partial [Planctomycetes bacterium]|nr:hypothetical protein [Planctomycetota bacterium]
MYTRRVGMFVGVLCGLVASAVQADDGVTLRYKRTKGEREFSLEKTVTKQSQTLMGMTFETSVESDVISSSTVDDIDEKGNYHLSQKTERIKVKGDFGAAGGTFEFDSKSSERDKASQIGVLLTPVLERMSGAVIQVVITPQGEVKEVKGFTELFSDLLKDNPLASQFTGGGTDEAAKFGVQARLPRFDKPLQIGDAWEVPLRIELPNVGKVTGKQVYKYVGPEKVGDRVTAKLEVGGDLAVDVNVEQGGAQVTGSIKTTSSTGTILFDVEAGHILSSEGTQIMGGD